MTSEDTIKEKLEELAQAIRPDEKLTENVMSRINAMPIANPSIGPAQNIWRTIMKNPITKLTAAAVIIIACSTGISLWRSTGSGIALADVLTRLEQVAGYTYQMNTTKTRQQTTNTWTSTVLISQENGIKYTTNTEKVDPNNSEIQRGIDVYILPQQNSMILINHEGKMYIRMKYEDTKLEIYRKECNDPRIIIKQILSCEHTSLGHSVIDGITVEGYQTTDPTYKGGFFGQTDLQGEPNEIDVKIWVDVNTYLPVRTEENIITKNGRHIHEVSNDFQWNVTVSPDDFIPNIPEDYKVPAGGDIVILDTNEENAIKGLRLYASLDGAYPVDLSDETLHKESQRLTGVKDFDSMKDLSDDEKTRKTSEAVLIQNPGYFYEGLIEGNKEPAYYGDTVGPDDANRVLLRWKLDDGQYRVIFGDLHADTVTADVMKELETTLSK